MTDSPFERFKQFVAQILTVTKEDIQKGESESASLTKPSKADERAEE
jgi:hypothetical protein